MWMFVRRGCGCRRVGGGGCVYDDETRIGQIASSGEVRVLELRIVSQKQSRTTIAGLHGQADGLDNVCNNRSDGNQAGVAFRRMWDELIATQAGPTNEHCHSTTRGATAGASAASTL